MIILRERLAQGLLFWCIVKPREAIFQGGISPMAGDTARREVGTGRYLVRFPPRADCFCCVTRVTQSIGKMFGCPFGMVFGSVGDGLGVVWGLFWRSSWDSFGIVVGSFWERCVIFWDKFGIVWGSFWAHVFGLPLPLTSALIGDSKSGVS